MPTLTELCLPRLDPPLAEVSLLMNFNNVTLDSSSITLADFWFSELIREEGRSYCRHFNPLNAELNLICYLLALLGAHHFLHVSKIRVKSLTLRLLMSYMYGAPILDVSRSHTTTHHSR